MKIYFDIGNTNIKVNFNLDDQEYYVAYDTKQTYTPDTFYKLLPDEIKNKTIESIMICSVVPSQSDVIVGMVKKYFRIDPSMLAFPFKTGIKIQSDNPKKTGSDIIALAAYASSQANESIIVNMGTATTITYVKDKTIKGVIIAPGLKVSKNALLSKAAKLNEIELYVPKNKVVGNSTAESISIGILKGHVHMINGLVKDISGSAKLFLSGGNSRKVMHDFDDFTYVKEATIEGMKVIEALNEK